LSRLPRINGKDCIKALERAGFTVVRIRGSHHILQHPDGRKTVVPVHGSEELGPGLLRNILSSCGIGAVDFVRLLKGNPMTQGSSLQLPEPIQRVLAPLLEAVPLDQAMPRLVEGGLTSGTRHPQHRLAEQAAEALADNPGLLAGLWLYVDDLDRAHQVCQDDASATGSYWHAIVHRREGDFSNSKYWLHRVGRHPAMADIDARALVDAVASDPRKDRSDLIDKQREEWARLFEWCAKNPSP